MEQRRSVTSRTTRHEVQQRLQAALANKPSRNGVPVFELNKIITPAHPVGKPTYEIRNAPRKRFANAPPANSPFAAVQRLEQMAANSIQGMVRDWLGNEGDWYLGFGGVGDALLLIAACYNNPDAKVVFFHNDPHFTRQWFNLFNIKTFLHSNIMGQRTANYVFDMMRTHPRFKTSAHLADGLDYGDWLADPYKYKKRLITNVPWIDYFGRADFGRPTVAIGPSGSSREIGRQRYLTNQEYLDLLRVYLEKDYLVLVVGSLADYNTYHLPNDPRCRWLMADGVLDHQGKKTSHTLPDMLRLVNGADEVVSVDTWLKTYTLLCGKVSKVILTRWNGAYRMIGSDSTDAIFLNKDIWPNVELYRLEDLMTSLGSKSPPAVRSGDTGGNLSPSPPPLLHP